MANPTANPPGTTIAWVQKNFSVKTTTTTIVVDESSSDDDWGEPEVVQNGAKRVRIQSPPAAKSPLKRQVSESVEAIWGDDVDDDGGWGDDVGGDEDDDWDEPGKDVWHEPEEDAEAFEPYPCPPEEDTHTCSSAYKGVETVVDVLDYATAARRLSWLEVEFQKEVPLIDHWPQERVRKLLSAHNYDFRLV